MNKDFIHNQNKIDNYNFSRNVRINLAEDISDVAFIILISLMAAARYPMSISEDEVHAEIASLADAGDWDSLAFKGLQWIQELSND